MSAKKTIKKKKHEMHLMVQKSIMQWMNRAVRGTGKKVVADRHLVKIFFW